MSYENWTVRCAAFKPTIRACDTGKLCDTSNALEHEKFQLQMALRYMPFSRYTKFIREAKLLGGTSYGASKLTAKHQELISEYTRETAGVGGSDITFNDDKVFAKIGPKLTKNTRGDYFDMLAAKMKGEAAAAVESSSDEDEKDGPASYEIETTDDEDELLPRNDQQFEKYKREVLKNIRCTRGKHLEPAIIDKFNREEGLHFVTPGDDDKTTVDYGEFAIVGKPDGVDAEWRYVLEVKTTQFEFERLGDSGMLGHRTQLMCYLAMKNCTTGFLLYNGPGGEQRVFVLEYDEKEFEREVLAKLRAFVTKFRAMNEGHFRNKLAKHGFFRKN